MEGNSGQRVVSVNDETAAAAAAADWVSNVSSSALVISCWPTDLAVWFYVHTRNTITFTPIDKVHYKFSMYDHHTHRRVIYEQDVFGIFFFRYSAIGQVMYLSTPFSYVFCHLFNCK